MKVLWSLALLGAFVSGSPLSAQPRADFDWWETSVFYQIYPRSYKDSNGDGVGDLVGITDRLDHLKDIGVGGVWLSPIYPSPMADFGYDISDFRGIDPLFGTMDDFDALLSKAKELGVKLILDFVPNHSSDEHEWFIKSVQKIDPYTDYYTWSDGKLDDDGNRIPPNKWGASFGGPAWTWREERQQYYLHQFHLKQPDLNYSNPAVVEDMKDVLRFWLDKGIDGFRMDAVLCLFEGPIDVPDSETSPPQNLPETYDMVKQWRVVLDEKSAEYGETKIMMLEVYGSPEQIMDYYGTPSSPGGHFPFNFRLLFDVNADSSAQDFNRTINDYMELMIDNRRPNWVLGNHDQHRVATRFGPELVDGMNFLAQLLPGIGVTYNGEEIGMENTYITWDQCRDPQGLNAGPDHYLEATRDLERTPFQWDNTTSAGFSTNETTWLPVNPNYIQLDLEVESEAETSHYKVYKQLTELRKTPTIQQGGYQVAAISDKVLGFTRTLEGADTVIVVVNLGDQTETVNLQNSLSSVPDDITVYAVSISSEHKAGETLSSANLELAAKEAFVFTAGQVS